MLGLEIVVGVFERLANNRVINGKKYPSERDAFLFLN